MSLPWQNYDNPAEAARQIRETFAESKKKAIESAERQQTERSKKKPPLKVPTTIAEYIGMNAEDIRALTLKPACKVAVEELFNKENRRRAREAAKKQQAEDEAADAMSQDFNTRIGGDRE